MINAHYFIDGELIDMWFDTINDAINVLTLTYLDRTGYDPEYIFMSYEVYSEMLKDVQTSFPQANSIPKFYTVSGFVEIKPVRDPKGRFIYVGDKEFERVFFGEEDAN